MIGAIFNDNFITKQNSGKCLKTYIVKTFQFMLE